MSITAKRLAWAVLAATVALLVVYGALYYADRDANLTTARKGAGLTNMADRLEAIGGVIRLYSAARRGRTSHGTIPTGVPAL